MLMLVIVACGGPSDDRARLDALRARIDPGRLTDQLVLVEAMPYADNFDDEAAVVLALGTIGGVWIGGGDAPSISRFATLLRHGAMVPPLVAADLDEGVGGLIGSAAAFPSLGHALWVASEDEARRLGAALGEDAARVGLDFGAVTRPPIAPGWPRSEPGTIGRRLHLLADAAAEGGTPLALRGFPGGAPADGDFGGRTGLELVELAPLREIRDDAAALVAGDAVLGALAGDTVPVQRSRQSLDVLRREEGWTAPIIADLRAHATDSISAIAIEAISAGADLVIVPSRAGSATLEALRTAAVRNQIPRWRLDAAVDRVLAMKLEASGPRQSTSNGDSIEVEPAPLPLAFEVGERLLLPAPYAARLDTLDVLAIAPVGRGGAFLAAAPPSLRSLRLNPGADSATIVELLRSEIQGADAVLLLDFPDTGMQLTRFLDAARDTAQSPALLRVAFGTGAPRAEPARGARPLPLLTAPGLGAVGQRAAARYLFPEPDGAPASAAPQGRYLRSAPAGDAGMSEADLAAVDSIILDAIADSAFTAAALAVGRGGVLARLRGYGTLADSLAAPDAEGRPVDPVRTLFDLASLTKVIGTTSAAAILIDDGTLALDEPVRSYVPEFRGGDRDEVTVRHLLTHTSGLPAWLPLFDRATSPEDALGQVIDQSLRRPPGERVEYSDLGMILLAEVVERAAEKPIEEFLAARLFAPLGMSRTMYLPPLGQRAASPPTLVPAERPFVLRGVVHDGNAFRLGGVAGHAGLFSTARDLATFAQMMLDRGLHRSARVLSDSTIVRFTTRQPDAGTRALGWDTPADRSNAGRYLSARSFGHTGYTGTSLWIDPTLDLFVVLLTNRTYPPGSAGAVLQVRMDVHEAVAQAIMDREVPPRPGARR